MKAYPQANFLLENVTINDSVIHKVRVISGMQPNIRRRKRRGGGLWNTLTTYLLYERKLCYREAWRAGGLLNDKACLCWCGITGSVTLFSKYLFCMQLFRRRIQLRFCVRIRLSVHILYVTVIDVYKRQEVPSRVLTVY